ncbi:MAG: hypothetical protein Q8P38_07090 [Candidatus Nanopelagicales bacterium]|nr:hypothetical protein [Candidatus Nanopelagicales bacterium]
MTTHTASDVVYCRRRGSTGAGRRLLGGMTAGLVLVAALVVGEATAAHAADPGQFDTAFNEHIRQSGGVDGSVNSVAVQSDGKIVVGGGFFGKAGDKRAYCIARFNANGTPDTEFNNNIGKNGGLNSGVDSVAVQSDGKIVVGGVFTKVGGKKARRIARFNANGTLDNKFNEHIRKNGGLNWFVNSVAVQSDGRIVVGGGFTKVGGKKAHRIARFNANGTPDNKFNKHIRQSGGVYIPSVMDGSVNSVAVQRNGKIVVGGDFTKAGGKKAHRIARFNANGTPANKFNKHIRKNGGVGSSAVDSVAVQRNGKIVVGGAFRKVGGKKAHSIARFNANGTPDNKFNKHIRGNGGLSQPVNSVAVQRDGKIVVGGWYDKAGGKKAYNIARLYGTT